MKLEQVKKILPVLEKYTGTVVKSKQLKIKKFLIIPLFKTGEFIQSYSIHLWDETGILDKLFSKKLNLKLLVSTIYLFQILIIFI